MDSTVDGAAAFSQLVLRLFGTSYYVGHALVMRYRVSIGGCPRKSTCTALTADLVVLFNKKTINSAQLMYQLYAVSPIAIY